MAEVRLPTGSRRVADVCRRSYNLILGSPAPHPSRPWWRYRQPYELGRMSPVTVRWIEPSH